MEKCADKEYDQWCGRSIVAQIGDWYVNVAHAPSMHWHIPWAPERVDIVGVPPIAIEVPVGKVQQFTDQIQKWVER